LGRFGFNAETVSPGEFEVGVPKEATSKFLNLAGKEGLFVQGKHSYRCVINGATLMARVAIAEPRERGECGGNPGGTISVTVNGREVLQVPFGNHCFPSAWSGGIVIPGRYDSPHADDSLTVCGYGRFQSSGDKKPKCATTPLSSPSSSPDRPFGLLELEKLVGDG